MDVGAVDVVGVGEEVVAVDEDVNDEREVVVAMVVVVVAVGVELVDGGAGVELDVVMSLL